MAEKFQQPVIIGLGKTGISYARYFHKKGVKFSINDSRDNPPGLAAIQQEMPEITISLGKFDDDLLGSASEIILSQGVSLLEPSIVACREKNIPIIGDLELFVHEAKAPIIAITGSNAKSTVTTLVGKMTQKAGRNILMGGNIGIPVLELLEQPVPEYYLLEVSNFQLEVTHSLQAAVACLLNISPDHLDCYHDYQDYIAVKRSIFKNCRIAVNNRDDRMTWLDDGDTSTQISFGFDAPEPGHFGLRTVNGITYLAYGDENWLACDDILLPGKQNWGNSLAALAIGHAIGLPKQAMLEAIKSFRGLAHRCEYIGQHQGVDWYNDSKGTNVGATQSALQGLAATCSGRIILLAGGLAKGADFSPLLPVLNDAVSDVILFGRDAQQIASTFAKSDSELHFVQSLEQAVHVAQQQAKSGDVVLLSPACASFDMFDNFEQRGEVYTELVNEVIHGTA